MASEPKIFKHIRPLVEAGFAVHWLHPKSKRPAAGNDWAQLPVADMKDLAESYKPGANVGVRPGRYSKVPNGYVHIVDVDIREADEKDEAWAAFFRVFPGIDIDELPIVQSGSGGESRHVYILCDQPFKSKKLAHSSTKYLDRGTGRKRWTWELDLIGTGKQAAIPPSIHPETGDEYAWLQEPDLDAIEMGLMPVIDASDLSVDISADRREEALEADDEAALLRLANRSVPLGLAPEDARRIVMALPLEDWCDDRDGWLKVGMALHHEFDADESGFEIWSEHSAQSDKFDADDQRRVWESFDSSRDETITMGYFRKLVADKGLDFEICLKALDEEKHYRPGLRIAAQYEFMASEQSVVASRLIELAREDDLHVSKKDVTTDLKAARKEYLRSRIDTDAPQASIESWLAEETLRVFFAKGKHLIYVSGTPWIYRSGVWRITDKSFIENRAYQVVAKLMRAADGAPAALVERVQESSRTDQLNALVNAVSNIIGKMLAEDPSDDPMRLTERHTESVINSPTAELWFEDGAFELRDHDPKHRFTNQVAAEYDESAKCPVWDKTIARIFAEQKEPAEVVRHLHEVMGYLVQSSRDHAMWLLMYGAGGNGKTVVAETLQALIGHNSTVAVDIGDLHSDKHATSSLVGKLLAIDDDFDKSQMLPSGLLKKLSESKRLTANPKFGSTFDFVSRATPVILTNHWPRTADNSYGLTRRAMVFHFNSRLSDDEKDETLSGYLQQYELGGILNRLIAGWGRVQARGGFAPPIDCVEAKNIWLGERNSLAAFIHLHVEVEIGADEEIRAKDVWDAFSMWADANNTRNNYGRNQFYKEIEALDGVSTMQRRRVKLFRNVRLVGLEEDFEGGDEGEVDDPEDLVDYFDVESSGDPDFDII